MNGLELWNQVETTDPKQTKEYKGKGGFSGTAIKPIYLIKKATELWGPMGYRWGARVVSENVFDGAPMLNAKGEVIGIEKLHSIRINLYYPADVRLNDGETVEGRIESYGHTLMVGSNKYGPFTDDEAPKKSFTDAIGKALHYLGFSADIYFGSFDGSKYDKDQPKEDPKDKPVPEDLKQKLTTQIHDAKMGKEIEEQIASLDVPDTIKGSGIISAIYGMPEGAPRERRKKLLQDKVKELGWKVVKSPEGVVTFVAPAGTVA